MKYRKLIKWPSLSSLHEFSLLAEQIEKTIGIKFIRHVNVGTNGLGDLDLFLKERGPLIKHWLTPGADTIGVYLQSQQSAGEPIYFV